MEKSEEIWKKLDFLECGENYSVSNLGNVRNDVTCLILKQYIKRGYNTVALSNRRKKYYCVHKILGQAFLDNPRDLPTVDHIDRNPLNNALENLRWASHSEQHINQSKRKNTSSKYIGVNYDKSSAKWMARIRIDGIKTYLGLFDDEEEAARVVDAASHSEFFTKNFP